MLSREEAIALAGSSSIHRASNAVEASEETGDESPYCHLLFAVSGSAADTCATASKNAAATPDVVTLELLGWFDFADLEQLLPLDLLDTGAVDQARAATRQDRAQV